jgi:hypothetical protein
VIAPAPSSIDDDNNEDHDNEKGALIDGNGMGNDSARDGDNEEQLRG